jgi:hypothetical protein
MRIEVGDGSTVHSAARCETRRKLSATISHSLHPARWVSMMARDAGGVSPSRYAMISSGVGEWG